MRIGLFGPATDPQCLHLARVLAGRGVETRHIHAEDIGQQVAHGMWGDEVYYRGERVDDITAFYMRQIPLAYPPLFQRDDKFVLWDDWFPEYMHRLEQHGYMVSWLLALEEAGATLLNPPFAGSVLQYKAYQLQAMRRHGLPLPKTLITNDPELVRRFAAEVGDVVFKPSMGGALCRPLDDEAWSRLDVLKHAPVIFQQRIRGDDVRVTMVGREIVSSVAIETDELDFRSDADYQGGRARYREVDLPPPVRAMCRQALRLCGLRFSGIDLKRTPEGDWYFLECNSSPIYLDVEQKTGAPITERMADLLLRAARRGPRASPRPTGLRKATAGRT